MICILGGPTNADAVSFFCGTSGGGPVGDRGGKVKSLFIVPFRALDFGEVDAELDSGGERDRSSSGAVGGEGDWLTNDEDDSGGAVAFEMEPEPPERLFEGDCGVTRASGVSATATPR